MITPIGEFLYELASGNDPQLENETGISDCVRVVVARFPYRDSRHSTYIQKMPAVVFKNKNYDGRFISRMLNS